ncbi:MAG: response regulator [bacterium]|nr:response regulator [bacterium]
MIVKRFFMLVCCVGCALLQVTLEYNVAADSVTHSETLSEPVRHSHIAIVTYGKYEGLLAKDVTGFVQDAAGYIYIGTNQGIWKYNGSQFYQVFSERDGLASGTVYNLFLDSQNAMWVSTSKGLNKISDGIVSETFSSGNIIWPASVEDQQGHIWYANTDSQQLLKLVDDEVAAAYGAENGISSAYAVLIDSNGHIWVGTPDGLVKFGNGQIERIYTEADGLRNNSIHVLFEDNAGNIWASDIDGGLSRIENNTVAAVIEPIAGYLEAALVDDDGNIWLGSASGLIRYRPGETPEIYTSADGLADNYVLGLFQDRAGNIWIGTVNGVSKITKKPIMYAYEGFKIYSQMTDEKGRIWLGTANGLYLFSDDRILRAYTVDDGLGSGNIKAIVEDRQHRVWVGTTKGLTLLVDDKIVNTFSTEDGLPDNAVWSLYEDTQERLWVGTNSGFAIMEHDSVISTHSGVADSSVKPRIEAIFQNTRGNVFVGANGYGLSLFQSDGTFMKQYTEADRFMGKRVRGIASDNDDNIWVVSSDGGVYQVVDEHIAAHYTSDEEAMLDTARSIAIDHDGTVWVGLDGFGVSNIAAGAFQKNYSYADGLINATVYSLGIDHDGHILIGTGTGLVTFDSTPFSLNVRMDSVTLPHIDERGHTYEQSGVPLQDGSYRFTYEQQSVRFRYASTDYRVESKRFQTILEGYDSFWRDMGPQAERTYMNLPSGSYTFKVRIQNFDGSWNPDEASVRLIVLPPYWETWWFRSIMAVILIILALAVFRLRVRTIEHQKLHLEQLVADRTQELTESNAQLTIAREKADVANHAKSAFLANMSHELRSPLNAILGFAQIMHRSTQTPREHIEHLSIIRRSGQHLLTLINQVLDLSKIEAGRIILNEKNIDVYRLLDDVHDMFQLKADEKHVRLIVQRDETVPRFIRSDDVKLRQVLINLLSNAMKFTEAGEIRLSVVDCRLNIEKSPEEGKHQSPIVALQFSISDTGPGIAPEELASLFEAFVQTETGRQTQEGTGLGLPISRKFVQLMGGDITVSSEVGRGTTCTFDIQVELADRSTIDNRQSALSRQVVALEVGQPRYRILIVDDKWMNRQLFFHLLQPLGFEAREAENGQQAIEIWEEWEPHVICMDIRMPVMDGCEATQKIRRVEVEKLRGVEGNVRKSKHQTPTIIIAVTASSLEEERAIVLSAGCDDFLRKPFTDAEVFEMLHKHLGAQFVYEKKTLSSINPSTSSGYRNRQSSIEKVLTPATLAALPTEWLDDLTQGARQADFILLSNVTEQIHGRDAKLAAALAQLVEDFEYDKILALLRGSESSDLS